MKGFVGKPVETSYKKEASCDKREKAIEFLLDAFSDVTYTIQFIAVEVLLFGQIGQSHGVVFFFQRKTSVTIFTSVRRRLIQKNDVEVNCVT